MRTRTRGECGHGHGLSGEQGLGQSTTYHNAEEARLAGGLVGMNVMEAEIRILRSEFDYRSAALNIGLSKYNVMFCPLTGTIRSPSLLR